MMFIQEGTRDHYIDHVRTISVRNIINMIVLENNFAQRHTTTTTTTMVPTPRLFSVSKSTQTITQTNSTHLSFPDPPNDISYIHFSFVAPSSPFTFVRLMIDPQTIVPTIPLRIDCPPPSARGPSPFSSPRSQT